GSRAPSSVASRAGAPHPPLHLPRFFPGPPVRPVPLDPLEPPRLSVALELLVRGRRQPLAGPPVVHHRPRGFHFPGQTLDQLRGRGRLGRWRGRRHHRPAQAVRLGPLPEPQRQPPPPPPPVPVPHP